MAIFRARSSRFCVFSKDFIGLTVSRTRLVGNFGELPKVFSSDMRLKSSESILFLIVVFLKVMKLNCLNAVLYLVWRQVTCVRNPLLATKCHLRLITSFSEKAEFE